MSEEVSLSKPFVRFARAADVYAVADNLREEDLKEIKAGSSRSPVQVLTDGFLTSVPCYAIEHQGKAIALFGCVPMKDKGIPWMLATPELKLIKKSFLREARGHAEKMVEDNGYLTNYVHAENKVHINWLKWMGFRFDEPVPHPKSGELFMKFHRGSYV